MSISTSVPTTRRRLNLEWNLATERHPSGTPSWQGHLSLKDHSPTELVSSYDNLATNSRNEVLLALLETAKHDEFCELAVMVLLLQRVTWRVSSARVLQGADTFTRDAMVMTAMHLAITHRAMGTDPRKAFSALTLNTLHELTRTTRNERDCTTEIPVESFESLQPAISTPSASEKAAEELVQLLGWAADSQALSSSQVSLLARIHLGGMSLADVATQDGVSIRTITTRATKAKAALKDAVQSHIDAWGTWS
ncbi:sigma-70 RNA polymerase sigma factor region 4 domain-containing protein [Arthrobacter woluwensis]|uniref:hypothetical protein n=1 Tax=Arthrobacter woluwensis TaxID=156980 RepID=UPI00380BA8D4